MFVASFGGTGIILKKLNFPLYGHLPLATVSGLAIAGITFYVFWKIMTATNASSEAAFEDLVGLEAEVITPIPSNGVGEIAYVIKQTRSNGPARSVDNRDIPARSVVRIVRIVSNIFYVERTA
jgi:membrane protein implicated in regulation of membrane protease activity